MNLENIHIPDPEFNNDQELKKTLINTKVSSRIGVALIVLPAIFLFAMLFKHYIGIYLGIIDTIENFFAGLDKSPRTKWLNPLIFGLLPLSAFVIIALSITHISYIKSSNLLHISVKIKAL